MKYYFRPEKFNRAEANTGILVSLHWDYYDYLTSQDKAALNRFQRLILGRHSALGEVAKHRAIKYNFWLFICFFFVAVSARRQRERHPVSTFFRLTRYH